MKKCRRNETGLSECVWWSGAMDTEMARRMAELDRPRKSRQEELYGANPRNDCKVSGEAL
jgi:hypothetical protein